MERTVDDVTQIAARSQRIREQRFPEIIWEHAHLVPSPQGLRAFCLYESPNPTASKHTPKHSAFKAEAARVHDASDSVGGVRPEYRAHGIAGLTPEARASPHLASGRKLART